MKLSVLAEVLPPGVFGIFDFMEEAERLIKEKAKACRDPLMAKRIQKDAFQFLCPCEKIQRLTSSSQVYRAHCAELLTRFEKGEDLRPATAAEILAHLSPFSLQVMLNSQGMHVYYKAFEQVFGKERAAELVGEECRHIFNPMPGFEQEELDAEWARLRKSLGDVTRKP